MRMIYLMMMKKIGTILADMVRKPEYLTTPANTTRVEMIKFIMVSGGWVTLT